MIRTVKKLLPYFCILFSVLYDHCVYAESWQGFYLGVLGGYGSTNWKKIHSSNDTLQTSLPSDAKDNGAVWGIFFGLDIARNYGLELRYQKFSTSKISFAQYNEYSPAPDFPAFSINSKTDSYSLLGKLRVRVNNTIELYSVLGGAYTQRRDQLANVNGFGGVFGAGTRLIFSNHFSNALEFDFVTGNAAIDLEPAKSYLPFLTSLNYKFIYSF